MISSIKLNKIDCKFQLILFKTTITASGKQNATEITNL